MALWISPKKLRALGVLGMNARNADYVLKYNKRKNYPNADSKIRSKRLVQAAGIPAPELYGVIRFSGEIKSWEKKLSEHSEFVIKPEHGSGGAGVLVLSSKDGSFLKPSGEEVSSQYIKQHLADTLGGLFSLGGQPDKALLEYRVDFDSVFDKVSFGGVPDIRVIVFHGIPVMAMLRLPTKQSDGKANLHQGAIGVGVDIISGKTWGGVSGAKLVDIHPDTKEAIAGVQIPHWEQILKIAAQSCEIFSLEYLGVDIVLDKNLGPLVLEVNVRPGLAVQIANRSGLKRRLKSIENSATTSLTLEERLSFSKEHFTLS